MKNKFILIMIILLMASNFTYGEDLVVDHNIVETSVKINDDYLYADTPHLLVEDTVFVVARSITEAFSGSIEWIAVSKTVIVIFDDVIIELTIGSNEAVVNGVRVELYKAPFIQDGRTMIPLKFISEYLDCDVSWIQETYTVEIKKHGLVVPEILIFERGYSDEDLYLLAKIVNVESGDQSLEMAIAIANTVLNRVKDPRFPSTIEEVIYQIDRYVQFPPAHKASFEDLLPSSFSIKASKRALEGFNNIGYSLYFNNQPFKSKSDDLIRIIAGEYFYE